MPAFWSTSKGVSRDVLLGMSGLGRDCTPAYLAYKNGTCAACASHWPRGKPKVCCYVIAVRACAPAQAVKAVLRRNGGVNLRNPWGVCFAEVQTLAWVPLLALACWCAWRLLLLCWAAAASAGEGEGASPPWREVQHGSHQQRQGQQYGHSGRGL